MKKRNIFVRNTPLDEALKKWRQALEQVPGAGDRTETIRVDDSLGRVTAGPVFARFSSPHYNGAAMDGIAVRFNDLAGASEARPVRLSPDSFAFVNTGNAMPPGFDGVVMIEDVHLTEDGWAELTAPATPWQHVRTIGEDIVATELILPAGHVIRPIDMGAMLATGIAEVAVHRIPEVLVIPTGSELVQPDGNLDQALRSPGKIIEFNSRILAGYLATWGARARRSPVVADNPEDLRRAVREAVSRHDLVVLNAGASAGSRDYTARILEELGTVLVHGVAIKPGKPVILAMVDSTPVIGLPGYPVSAVLTLDLFVRDLIYTFQGREPKKRDRVTALLSRPVASKMGVDEFVRMTLGKVGDKLMATPAGKGAGAVMSLVRADALLTIGAGSEGIGAGEEVEVELLRPLSQVQSTLVFIGSHDNILDIMANELHRQRPVIRISSAHVGSMGGITAIRRNEAHLAGTHLLDEESGEYNIPFIRRFLADVPLLLINLAHRQQGLLVAPGNPRGISGIHDLAHSDLIFINRQRGAGTRLLTDKVLRREKIDPAAIRGYGNEEYTHMNVAAAVAGGSADAGMGILAAANALGLEFIPVAEERYDLIILKRFMEDEKIMAVLQLIRYNRNFQNKVLALGGYDLRDCGKVMYEQ